MGSVLFKKISLGHVNPVRDGVFCFILRSNRGLGTVRAEVDLDRPV